MFRPASTIRRGTTTTMMSQLLWWLAEHKSRVLTIMTTNNSKVLPKELYREGRIDEVMWFSGLGPIEGGGVRRLGARDLRADQEDPPADLMSAKTAIVEKSLMSIPDTGEKRVSQAALTKARTRICQRTGIHLVKG